jgi:hypothetical protein
MYIGPQIDDREILASIPADYRGILETVNGFFAYYGGLHVRGACLEPSWHSLRAAWFSDDAIHRLFPSVLPSDVPFGQDALGDQFLLRDDRVWKLEAESGEVASLDLTLAEFDAAARADPDGFLQLAPLHEFRAQGGRLEPGYLLSVVPPFVFRESADGVTYAAVPVSDRLHFLSQLARGLRDLPDGARVRLVTSQ